MEKEWHLADRLSSEEIVSLQGLSVRVLQFIQQSSDIPVVLVTSGGTSVPL